MPKRSDQRRRRNAPGIPVTKGAAGPPPDVEVRRPNHQWHPVAKRFFESLAKSGQAAYYEESDWATAWLLCESMSRHLKPQKVVTPDGKVVTLTRAPAASVVAGWLKGAGDLMATESARRRLSLELEHPPEGGTDEEGDANVVWLADAAARANAAG